MKAYYLNKNTIITPKQAGQPLLAMPKGCAFAIDLDNKLRYGDNHIQLTDKQVNDLLDRSSFCKIEED